MGLKPMRWNRVPMATGSGAAYSMNSNPSVPMGFSQTVEVWLGRLAFMVVSIGVGECATVSAQRVTIPAFCGGPFVWIAENLQNRDHAST